MFFARISTVAFLAITGVSAGKGRPKHGTSPPASIVSQANQCGNDATPYCCNNEVKHGGEANCNSMGTPSPGEAAMSKLTLASDQSSICDTTVICCNANEVSWPIRRMDNGARADVTSLQSIQVCAGNVIVEGGDGGGESAATGLPDPGSLPKSEGDGGSDRSVVSQANQCGNGITPYCCNNEALDGGEANCNAIGRSHWRLAKPVKTTNPRLRSILHLRYYGGLL